MLTRPILKSFYWSLRAAAALARRAGGVWATGLHRATLASVGKGTRFQSSVRFAQPGIVSVGAGCYFWRGCEASAEIKGAPLIIADHVQINRDVQLDTTGGLTIGAGTMISERAVIYTHDHGHDPRAVPRMMPKTIARDVWIGAGAVILPQCQWIGQGAVIGAGAVVTGDVPAGAIVGGNPARILNHAPRTQVAA
ncbi:acyltransferase [Yoonia sp. 2307UL14-13]|uniref:acyltransferase n=1 Tax=Yoonia sp. 2307UL14-13 TaxID=3126506 RepID=UPI0030A8D0EA